MQLSSRNTPGPASRAARAVGVADLSSFGKFELTGSEARRLLDLASANTVPPFQTAS